MNPKIMFPRIKGSEEGFTLVEMLLAIIIMTFGLLAAGQMMASALGNASLTRSKGTAAVVAQDRLEALAQIYQQDPRSATFDNGTYGPVQIQITNPTNSSVLNRYNVSWTVSSVADPRAGVSLLSKQVQVTVTPINALGAPNNQRLLNKTVTMSAIFSPKV
jgi:prepilin-type N-terminal cleavage/methylation domain-containing protein